MQHDKVEVMLSGHGLVVLAPCALKNDQLGVIMEQPHRSGHHQSSTLTYSVESELKFD